MCHPYRYQNSMNFTGPETLYMKRVHRKVVWVQGVVRGDVLESDKVAGIAGIWWLE